MAMVFFMCDELGLVLLGVSSILKNGCGCQGQKYVAKFSESEMSAGLHSWNLILAIKCCRLSILIVNQWSMFMNFLLKTIDRGDRGPNVVIFVVLSAITVGWWVALVWSRKSYLGLAESTSYVFLVLFKDWEHMVSSRFHLFVFDVNQGNEEAGWVQGFLRGPRDGKISLRSNMSC